jgi:polyisoprenyl-phosphate glycosyltransferase
MTAAKPRTIAFVIPCYNEQAGIQHTLTCLLGDINKLKKAKAISPNSYVLLVDDGSTDRTRDLIEKISNAQPKRVRALKCRAMSDIRTHCWPVFSHRSEKPMR